MKYAAAVIALLVSVGCAAKKPVKITVPGKCILGGVVNASGCKPLSKDEAVCNGVVIKFACIEVKK